jgi:hypothetical protein
MKEEYKQDMEAMREEMDQLFSQIMPPENHEYW